VLLGGAVGGSSLGRHLRIEPRFALARFLFESGARVLMDVSDGLALDLERIAARSRVRIDLERVPVHRDARLLARTSGRSALTDGEDHELIATLAPRSWARIAAAAGRRFPALVVVGRVRRGSGLFVARSAAPAGDGRAALVRWEGRGGWVHGG
jgi:thiamine monophosphate kinase